MKIQKLPHAQGGGSERLRKVIPGKIAEAGLYFPTVRGEGHRIEFAAKNMAEAIRPEDQLALFDVFSAGSFQPSITDECQFCNAYEICPYRQLEETTTAQNVETAESGEEE